MNCIITFIDLCWGTAHSGYSLWCYTKQVLSCQWKQRQILRAEVKKSSLVTQRKSYRLGVILLTVYEPDFYYECEMRAMSKSLTNPTISCCEHRWQHNKALNTNINGDFREKVEWESENLPFLVVISALTYVALHQQHDHTSYTVFCTYLMKSNNAYDGLLLIQFFPG